MSWLYIMMLTAVLYWYSFAVSGMADLIIETCEGKIQGMVTKNHNGVEFYTFRGIPYAKPPVGNLRFSIPQPPEPWEGIRDGTMECQICPQLDKETNTVVGDEDCLYLNVYTPKLPSKDSTPLAVMFFLHGGGFLFGNGIDSKKHGPEFLIEKDVVMVSLNYRVGILGFLALGLKEAPGNMGLRDQVLALLWAKKNIRNFGGDPDNVTIFGISAGGASVEYLLLSPLASGLFHRAIAQSGSSLLPWAQNAETNNKKIALKIPVLEGKTITDDVKLLQYLKDLSINELISSSTITIFSEKFKGGIYFGFVPTVEKANGWEPFIEKSTYQMLSSGIFSKVPYMSGICTREGLLTACHYEPILNDLVNEKNFLDHFPFELDDVEKADIAAQLKTIYLEGEHITDDEDAFAIDFFTDTDFFGGIYTSAKLISKHTPVYFYEFSYDGALNYFKKKYNIDRRGACHGDDGGYILKDEILTDNLSESDKFVQNLMLDLWTNFAKNGNPNLGNDKNITWDKISETDEICYVIDKEPTIKQGIYPKRAKFYWDLYKKSKGYGKQ